MLLLDLRDAVWWHTQHLDTRGLSFPDQPEYTVRHYHLKKKKKTNPQINYKNEGMTSKAASCQWPHSCLLHTVTLSCSLKLPEWGEGRKSVSFLTLK